MIYIKKAELRAEITGQEAGNRKGNGETMKRFGSIAILVLFVLGVLYYGIIVAKDKEKEKTAVPIKAELTVYSDIPDNIAMVLAQSYEASHHVRITILPLTESQMAERLQLPVSEQTGDLIFTSQDNLMLAARQKQVTSIMSEATDAVADRFKDPEGLWVGLWIDPVIFAQSNNFYNGQGRYVTTWHSLALPGSWRVIQTDFIAAQSAANILYSFVEIRGEEEALKYFIELKPHITQYAKFLSTPVRLASLGETDLGIGNYSDGRQYMLHNYPVKIIFPGDGTPYYLTGVGLLKNSQKAAESKEFIAWLLSKQTAQLMIDNGFYYIFMTPEVPKPMDSLGREPVLLNTRGGYTEEGKKVLLNLWIDQVRFRRN